LLIGNWPLAIGKSNLNTFDTIFQKFPFTFAISSLIIMKKLLPVFILTLFCEVTAAQDQYQVMSERPHEKTYKGIISREALTSDTSFHWYANGLKGYHPNKAAIEGLKANKDSIQLLVFMGTWCEDSHYIIPKFYTLLDTAGFSPDKVTLIGVDRQKKTLSHLCEALGVTNVPTIIVLKNGKELGRVVEYGKTGLFDKDIAEILQSVGK
jgi:thiol-disulfide isomerase/thioredoxin